MHQKKIVPALDKGAARCYVPPMLKTTLVWFLALVPLFLGVKVYATAIALHDDHLLTVARCMGEKQKTLDIGPQEAYIVCEREAR